MEELGWERNMSSFPWSNINHHQHELEENLIFGSENILFNPIQDIPKPDSNPIITGTPGQHHQLAPAINVTSSFGSASQYWRQTINGLHEGKNVIPHTTSFPPVISLESLDYTTSLDHEDGISLIFSGHKNLHNKVFKNIKDDVVSSDGSVTKDTDENVDSPRSKKPRSDPGQSTSSTINFRQTTESDVTDSEVVAQMKEMIYTAAAFRPVSFADDEVVQKRKRKNVRISSDPQTVAARRRREKVSDRIRVLQKLVPGGDKMDTASMLDEAANYLKFLRSQVKAMEQLTCGTTTNAYGTSQNVVHNALGVPFTYPMHASFLLPYQQFYPNSSRHA